MIIIEVLSICMYVRRTRFHTLISLLGMKHKWSIFVLLLIGCCFLVFPAFGYDPPRRAIVVSPYVQILSTRNFSVFSRNAPPAKYDVEIVEDQIGFGIGINVSTRLSENWGYFLDYAVGPLEVKYSDEDRFSIFVLGVSYSVDALGGKMILDAGYGVSHWGKWAGMIFMPSLGYSKRLTERTAGFAKVGCPIVEEHYTSFSFSTGINILF